MCITVGGAKRNLRITPPTKLIRRLRCASPPVMHITPLAGLRFRLPCGKKNLPANADATLRRTIIYLVNWGHSIRRL
ncbi:MAG: hypothetical protein LBU34_08000 [Planctomycetaceae bacterium]|nr:hypothetical protein [Planctomycetaceae bacterium]